MKMISTGLERLDIVQFPHLTSADMTGEASRDTFWLASLRESRWEYIHRFKNSTVIKITVITKEFWLTKN